MNSKVVLQPNTFIIGAMKSATTSLHTCLDQHPEIFMSRFKEPGYFLGPTKRRRNGKVILSDQYRNDWDAYLSLFAGAGGSRIIGESTTDYTKYPCVDGVAQRIHRYNPSAKLIYLMRDPIERTISHYWWAVEHEEENRDILTAIAHGRPYQDVSHYAMQLEEYLKYFPREQLMVLTAEDYSANFVQVLHRIFVWLELADTTFRPTKEVLANLTPKTVRQTRSKLLKKLRFSRIGNLFSVLVPATVRQPFRRLAERELNRAEVDLGSVKEFLRPIQLAQTEHLSDLLRRRFPEWTTLYGLKQGDRRLAAR